MVFPICTCQAFSDRSPAQGPPNNAKGEQDYHLMCATPRYEHRLQFLD